MGKKSNTIDIRFDRHYLYMDVEGNAVIMKVEPVNSSSSLKAWSSGAQNFICREGDYFWTPVTIDEFNALDLAFIFEYDPEPEPDYKLALDKLLEVVDILKIDKEELDTNNALEVAEVIYNALDVAEGYE